MKESSRFFMGHWCPAEGWTVRAVEGEFDIFPELEADERSVLEKRAACKLSAGTGWKEGRLFLTDRRLVFCHGGRLALNISYDQIAGMRVKARFLALKRKKVLGLSLRKNGRAGRSSLWLAVNEPASLAGWLFRMSAPLLTSRVLGQVVSRIGEGGRAVINHLAGCRHAAGEEVAGLLGATNAEEVSQKVEQAINSAARRVLGRDIVVFRELWRDVDTGEMVRDSWWLAARVEPIDSPPGTAGRPVGRAKRRDHLGNVRRELGP